MSDSSSPNKNISSGRRDFLKAGLKGAVVAGSTFAAPNVIASKSIRWKMVTTWPKNFPGVGTGANRLAENIGRLSNGRIKVKVYGAGELVPAMGVFDAVKRGTAQMGHGASYYWKGKHEGTQFFAAVPFGLNAQEMGGWLKYGGGQKLWDELYAQFGLKPFPAGNTGVQMGGWFKKQINSPKDFKGLRIRMPGLGGDVLSSMGAAVQTLSGGEIFQALKAGTIDATEWIGPFNDLAFGLHNAAKIYYWPGWHEPSANLEAMVNKKAYESLPKDLQAIVQVACEAAAHDILSEFTAQNANALVTLVNKHKVKLMKYPDPVLKALGDKSKEVVEAVAKKDPMSKKIYASYNKFRGHALSWGKISEEGYSIARALTYRK